MRHRVYGRHLGRNKDERDRLFKGLVSQLFLHGTIQTSSSKAKAIKALVDKVINLAKGKNTKVRLQSFLTDKNLQDRLVKEIVPKLGTRTSGYTSMIRMGPRQGDQTMIVKMSLIGVEQLKPMEKYIGNREQKKTILTKKITPKKPVVRKRVSKTKK